MSLFIINKGGLKQVNEKKIDLEKDIQKLTEDNLGTVFGLKFVSTEFRIGGLRIDTLAFDEETRSFVIIEYKRDRSFSVVDQGFAYLSLMLRNKADFVLEYNENNAKSIKREDVDWSQSRVLFVANSFTTYQQEAIQFKDMQFELWEVKKYDNDTILYNQLKADKSSESINLVTKNQIVDEVSKVIKSYTVDYHFKENWTESREIFDALRERILALDSRLEESPQKTYIGYKIGNSVAVDIRIYKSAVDLELPRVEPKDLRDSENRVKYVPRSMEHFNKHISHISVRSVDDIDYAVQLAKQVLDKFFKN